MVHFAVGGHNADSEAYSNSVHLATVENIATSYINLNQLLQEETADKERQRKEAGADSSDDDTATDATDAASAAKKNKGASELQKEAICKQNSVKWRVMSTHGKPPPERYRHSATVVRHKISSKGEGGGKGGSVACSLVVYGGLGRGNVPCNDVYILDLDTLEWRELTPSTPAASDTWPVNGLYGHCALPM